MKIGKPKRRGVKARESTRSRHGAQLLQECRHVVIVGDFGNLAVTKCEDGCAAQAKAVAARGQFADRPGLNSFADPFRCRAMITDNYGRHRYTKVRRPGERGSQELFDLFLSSVILASGNIIVDSVVSEDRIDSLRLMQGPSSEKLVHESMDLLRRGCRTHCTTRPG